MDSKIMKFAKVLLCAVAFVPMVALANEGGPALDKAPDKSRD